jgi:MHS family shikimate/dehydroshikimate transporter-like MFS transporter
MAYEHAPAEKRGFYGSWPQMGAPAGLLLANFVFLGASALPESAFLAWGWRTPFLLSSVLVLLGLVVRRTISESPAFAQLKQARGEARQPLLEVLRTHPRAVLAGVGGRAAEAGFIVIFSVFALGYAIQVDGFARPAVLSALLLGTLCTLVAVPVFGVLSDRVGRRPVYVAGAVIASVAAVPACLLIDSRQVGLMTLGVVIGMLGPGIIFGPQASFLAEMFPARVRSSGTSIGFQSGGVLAGGLSPIIAASLVGITGTLLPVGGYMVALGLVSLASVALAKAPASRAAMAQVPQAAPS